VTVAIRQGGSLVCPLCSEPLRSDEPRRLEHMVPLALGGTDDIGNLAWVHADCAKVKDFGNKATCADGDIHRIAKAKRLAEAQRVHKAVVARTMRRDPSRLQGRGFEHGQRPIPKRKDPWGREWRAQRG